MHSDHELPIALRRHITFPLDLRALVVVSGSNPVRGCGVLVPEAALEPQRVQVRRDDIDMLKS